MKQDNEPIEGQFSIFDLVPEDEERKPCEYSFKRYIGQVVRFKSGEVGVITDIEPYYTEVRTDNHRIMAGTPTTISPVEGTPAQEYFEDTGKTTYWQDSQGKPAYWWKSTPKTFEDYIGQCKYCMWYGYGLYREPGHKRKPGTEHLMCQWTEGKNPYCKNKSFWKPGDYKIPRLCSNCAWANQFCYQRKPEYKEDSLKAFHDPVEEPNIYCTHEDGSVNRQSPYKDFWEKRFGCNTWDRQHEWDTCDAWRSDGWKLKEEDD